MNKILLLSLLVLSTACIKTADQVNREKKVDNMSEQLRDSQGLVADAVEQMKEMRSQMDKLNGRLDELEHRQGKISPDQLTKTAETVEHLKTQQDSENNQLQQIQNELKEQRAFIEKVTATLGSMTHHAAPKEAKGKKKSVKSELAEALDDIKNDKYDAAREVLESLIEHKDLSPGDQNKVFQGLGKVEYYTKNYDKALVYFSKVYTKYPKASLAPSCLLFIGRTLEKMGKKAEAKEAFAKVGEDYPGSKEAAEAKKEL
jgi:TolA-binding protein